MTATWTAEELVATLPQMEWRLLTPEHGGLWQTYLHDYSLPKESDGFEHYVGRLDSAGFDIVVQAWQPKNPTATAYIAHGYYDHVGLYRHLIWYCLKRGWRVITFDLPGHGLSSGERSSIDSFQQYDEVFDDVLTHIQQNFNEPIHTFGQSTGGAILINYLLKRGIKAVDSPFASVSLMAPLVRPKEWRKAFWLHKLLRRWVRQMKRGRSVNSSDQSFLDFLWHNDPLQASLLSVPWVGAMKEWVHFIEAQPATDVDVNIVQGDDDNTVAWRHNLNILAQKFPQQNLKIIEGGRHHLVNESEDIRLQIWNFLDKEIHA